MPSSQEQSTRIRNAVRELELALDAASRPGLELKVEHEYSQRRAIEDQFRSQFNHRIRITATESI